MNRSTLAGIALAGAIAITAPNAAWSQGAGDLPPQPGTFQPQAGDRAPPGGPGFRGGPGGRFMGPGPGGMMGPGSEMGPDRREMMHRMMMHRSPQERCLHRVARRAGMVAYTVTMLNLTQEQRPMWDRLNDVVQQNLQKVQLLCASLGQDSGQETPLDRLDRAERFVSARLQAIQQIRPPLQQLYQALNPEQKAVLDRMFRLPRERL
jgi:hypothetical protein